MKQKRIFPGLLFLLTLVFLQLPAMAQDSDDANKLPPKETSPATWFTQPWIWIAGVIVVAMILIGYFKWIARSSKG